MKFLLLLLILMCILFSIKGHLDETNIDEVVVSDHNDVSELVDSVNGTEEGKDVATGSEERKAPVSIKEMIGILSDQYQRKHHELLVSLRRERFLRFERNMGFKVYGMWKATSDFQEVLREESAKLRERMKDMRKKSAELELDLSILNSGEDLEDIFDKDVKVNDVEEEIKNIRAKMKLEKEKHRNWVKKMTTDHEIMQKYAAMQKEYDELKSDPQYSFMDVRHDWIEIFEEQMLELERNRNFTFNLLVGYQQPMNNGWVHVVGKLHNETERSDINFDYYIQETETELLPFRILEAIFFKELDTLARYRGDCNRMTSPKEAVCAVSGFTYPSPCIFDQISVQQNAGLNFTVLCPHPCPCTEKDYEFLVPEMTEEEKELIANPVKNPDAVHGSVIEQIRKMRFDDDMNLMEPNVAEQEANFEKEAAQGEEPTVVAEDEAEPNVAEDEAEPNVENIQRDEL